MLQNCQQDPGSELHNMQDCGILHFIAFDQSSKSFLIICSAVIDNNLLLMYHNSSFPLIHGNKT